MAYSVPRSLVTGAPRQELPYGLFSVVTPREGNTVRFENGVEFEGIDLATPDSGGLIGSFMCKGDDPENSGATTFGLPKGQTSARAMSEASEFTIYELVKCSPIGNDLGASQRLAIEALTLNEQRKVEWTLWTGAVGNTPNFTEATALTAGTSAREAIAELEDTLAWEYGSQGVLHVPYRLASSLAAKGDLTVSGGRLYTGLGTPVVAGAGYRDSSGEPVDTIVITPPMFAFRTEIFTSSQTQSDLLDRSKNDLYGVAERTYVIAVDQPDHIYSITLTEE